MTNSSKKMIKEMSLGMVVYFVIMSIPVLLITHDKIKGEGGLLAGVVVAFLMLLSMNASVEHAIHMQGKQGAYMGVVSAVRLIIVAVFLLVIGFTGWLNMYTTLVGLLSLKVGTYLQPFTAKLLGKAKESK